jgi:hypothetical protein
MRNNLSKCFMGAQRSFGDCALPDQHCHLLLAMLPTYPANVPRWRGMPSVDALRDVPPLLYAHRLFCMPSSKTAALDFDARSGQVDRRSDYSASCCSPSATKEGDVKHVTHFSLECSSRFKGTSRRRYLPFSPISNFDSLRGTIRLRFGVATQGGAYEAAVRRRYRPMSGLPSADLRRAPSKALV